MGSLRSIKRKIKEPVVDPVYKMMAIAVYQQMTLLGLGPNDIDPADLKETRVSGGGRTITHVHYKNLLLVEKIETVDGKVEVNVPKLEEGADPQVTDMEEFQGAVPA